MIIGIGKNVERRTDFKWWLQGKGYDVILRAKSSYNGIDIKKDPEAKAKWKELWYEFEIDSDV